MRLVTIIRAAALAMLPALAAMAVLERVHAQVSRPAAAPTSPWVKAHNAAARLIAGALPPATSDAEAKRFAGVEIRMSPGWKTYWRSPGDDGGLPPSFEWQGSRNLKAAHVLYPAPKRMKSLNGTAIGYESTVVFPVELVAENPAEPIELALAFEYGICKDICVPAEARFALTVPANLTLMPLELNAALRRVPQPAGTPSPLRSATAELSGPSPAILLDIEDPTGGRADLFAETPAGTFMPVAQKDGPPTNGIQRFRIGLEGVDEVKSLAGMPLRLTITRPSSATELTWTVR